MNAERFWQKVDRGEDCWLWTGYLDRDGYGRYGKGGYAHRVAYELAKGPIPEGLEIDHLCRNRACVNPEHLEAVPHAVNVRRGSNTIKTACKRGHLFDEANTMHTQGRRRCRACHNAANASRLAAESRGER